ncbi:MAG TPA: gliding motility-associated C-terminal domain-containing protein, partial [Anaerovoracaceae bacterium]|nr:gliding motility-associated C-terminal domain-containing protein [Anaerovoracaceae bacterium]
TEGYHFTIISRWNDIVFEAKEEIKGWNGQMQNGSPAPAGNYVWILDFSDFLGRRHRQTGTVTLVY